MRTKNTVAAVLAAVVILATAMPASADPKTAIGWSLIAGGGGMVAGAWDYESGCPPGYTTHTYDLGYQYGKETYCAYANRYGSDVRKESVSATFARPTLLRIGLATVGVGVLTLALPSKAKPVTKDLEVSVTPGGWSASKAVRFK